MPPNVVFATPQAEAATRRTAAGRGRWYAAASVAAIVVIAAIATAGGNGDTSETAADEIESVLLPMVDDDPDPSDPELEPPADAAVQGLVGSQDDPATTTATTLGTTASLRSTTASSFTTTSPTATEATTATTPTTRSTTTTATAPPTTAVVTTAESTTTLDCHPAYVECLPNLAGDALNCGDLSASVKPVHLRDVDWDPYGLDGNDRDGLGCESG